MSEHGYHHHHINNSNHHNHYRAAEHSIGLLALRLGGWVGEGEAGARIPRLG